MIVTLCTGSACATDEATSACPISWWATMSRSFSDKTRLFFSSPATIRSIASSKSAVVTASFSLRAASRAASLTMFARSAPAKPGVRAAITPRSTSGARTTARACNLKIASRPRTSGLSTTTWRSKRPGRSSARSRTSGRVVAGIKVKSLRGAHKHKIQDLGAVRRGNEDHAFRGVEAVHLGEELVQGLLALVVAADEPGGARPRLADRVQLVDEDDARRLVLRLLEQVAHEGQ